MGSMSTSPITAQIQESIATKQRLLASCTQQIEKLCDLAVETISRGGKIMLCGNGGSSCDASHAAGELVGWFEKKNRRAYAAIALGHETPTLTAVGNDAGYEYIFSRQVEALGKPGDLLIGISTSGGSKNVLRAVEAAKKLGIAIGALVGEKGGPIAELADAAVKVPSKETPRIQESHLLCVHILCGAVEARCPA